MDWTCILCRNTLVVSRRCSQYPEFIMSFLNRKVTLSSRRDEAHWSVEETFATEGVEPVWSAGNGWYWTESKQWFELIPRNRSGRHGGGWRDGASGSGGASGSASWDQ